LTRVSGSAFNPCQSSGIPILETFNVPSFGIPEASSLKHSCFKLAASLDSSVKTRGNPNLETLHVPRFGVPEAQKLETLHVPTFRLHGSELEQQNCMFCSFKLLAENPDF
jgi:hypothetical protein